MTLFNLAWRNVKSNLKRYFLYIGAMVMSVLIFYTFKAIQYHSQIQAAASSSQQIGALFSVSSVILLIFISFFMIYSNSFFTRQRKKEVGLYSLLGLPKRKIANLLFYENLMIGGIALLIGIGLGTLLSRSLMELLTNLMQTPLSIQFEWSTKAVIHTAVVFLVLILFTSFQGYRLIYRFQLVELFQADQKGERIPRASWLLAIIGVIGIGVGYYFSLHFFDYVKQLVILLPLGIVCSTVVGTYLLFHCVSIVMLKGARKRSSYFYKGMNMISTSFLLYRIKGHATSLATITTLTAVTLCAIGTSVGLFINQDQTMKRIYPYSYSYVEKDAASEEKVKKNLEEQKQEHPVTKEVTFSVLVTPENPITFISQSSFNRLARTFDYQEIKSLKKDQAVKLISLFDYQLKKKVGMGRDIASLPVALQGRKLTLSVTKELPAPLQNGYANTYVISDEQYESFSQMFSSQTQHVLNVEDDKETPELTKELEQLVDATSFYTLYKQNTTSTGIMVFIGGFLGLVFVLATGSMIYFKQLAEAEMDKPNYAILRKVGVSQKDVASSVRKQLAFVFGLPLIVAIAHSMFAFEVAKPLLMITDVRPIFISIGVYILIYGGYYLLTVRSYVRQLRDPS